LNVWFSVGAPESGQTEIPQSSHRSGYSISIERSGVAPDCVGAAPTGD
jgi:hypothetical protein